MTPEQRYRLISRFEIITSSVLAQDLTDLLYQDKLINENDMQEIDAQRTQISKTRHLARILLIKNHPATFDTFLQVLERKGYGHIRSQILEQQVPSNEVILNELYGNQLNYDMTVFESARLFESDRNIADYQISARLHSLAQTGETNKLTIILIANPNLVHLRTPNKKTLLHTAADCDPSGELARFLLQNGLEVDLTDSQNETSLHAASVSNNFQTVRVLLEHGANPHARDQYRATPLHHACFHDNHQCAEFLLAVGCEVNIADQFGDTPLHHACVEDAVECVNLLLTHNASLTLRNNKGETPPECAVKENCERVLRLLRNCPSERENMLV